MGGSALTECHAGGCPETGAGGHTVTYVPSAQHGVFSGPGARWAEVLEVPGIFSWAVKTRWIIPVYDPIVGRVYRGF